MYLARWNRQWEIFEKNGVGYFSAITMLGFNLNSSELSSKQLPIQLFFFYAAGMQHK